MTGKRMLRGGCLCGAVGYEVADAFEYAQNCHCSQCRRVTGWAFKPFAGIGRAQLAVTQGCTPFRNSELSQLRRERLPYFRTGRPFGGEPT
jgi:hypothetical protein